MNVNWSPLASKSKSHVGGRRPTRRSAPRPPADLAVAPATGFAFPSGHATASFTAFVVLAWLATAVLRRAPVRVAAWVVAAVLVAGFGLSRVYLGVHYLTDVLGAWTLATTCLGTLLLAMTLAAALTGTSPPPLLSTVDRLQAGRAPGRPRRYPIRAGRPVPTSYPRSGTSSY